MTSYKMKSAKFYDKYYENGANALSGSGKAKNKTNQADLTLQVSNISWSCDTVNVLYPRHNKKSHRVHMLTQWANNVTLHSSVLPRLPWRILGLPLSSIGLLSPPRMVSFSSFLEQVLHRHVTVLTDPAQVVSFVDWCLSFLHRMASHSTCRSSQDQTENYVSQSWMSHDVFLGRVLSPHTKRGTTTQ